MSTAPGPAESRACGNEIIRRKAHSFYFAANFLPPDKRRDVYALYAFCRTVDDLVDERPADRPAAAVIEELDRWRGWLAGGHGPSADPLRSALGAVIDRHHIPTTYFLELLDGVQHDLRPCRMATFAELERYCYLVAGTVGLVLSHVLGATDGRALARARTLGIAMQLTNVLRDIGEDLGRGMIYLPADELARFGYSAERLARRRVDSDFVALMRMQIARARDHYRSGMAGIRMLPPDSQFPVLLAARMYMTILRKIELSGYDVFGRRAHTGLPEKLWIAARAYARLRRRGSLA